MRRKTRETLEIEPALFQKRLQIGDAVLEFTRSCHRLAVGRMLCPHGSGGPLICQTCQKFARSSVLDEFVAGYILLCPSRSGSALRTTSECVRSLVNYGVSAHNVACGVTDSRPILVATPWRKLTSPAGSEFVDFCLGWSDDMYVEGIQQMFLSGVNKRWQHPREGPEMLKHRVRRVRGMQ